VAFNYPVSITQKNSTLVLVLSNYQNYHHPLCKKTLTNYLGTVTSPNGWRDDKPYKGVDLEFHLHDSILCSFDGKVQLARNYDGYGKVLIVRHYNRLETLYAHLNKIKVNKGEVVKAEHFIGTGCMTGNTSSTHLHFEIRFKGIPLNHSHIISFRIER
jgi:murein DD-endopeptidase MepM/ murein hydrolase activator NlpD